jgi:hypothetical protein
MVSVLAIRPKVCGFKPGQGTGLLRVIKIHSMPSFGEEVKPAPCHKIFIACKKSLASTNKTL